MKPDSSKVDLKLMFVLRTFFTLPTSQGELLEHYMDLYLPDGYEPFRELTREQLAQLIEQALAEHDDEQAAAGFVSLLAKMTLRERTINSDATRLFAVNFCQYLDLQLPSEQERKAVEQLAESMYEFAEAME